MAFTEGGRTLPSDQRALALAESSVLTDNSGHRQLEYFRLTKKDTGSLNYLWGDFKGKSILDVGAGASDFTARLLERGADAYAVDLRYGHMPRIAFELSRKRKLFASTAFQDSVLQDPGRYVEAFAHKLPFADDSFDAVTSHFGIFGDVIDLDPELLSLSVNEAIRVLKPDGVLRIGPYLGGNLSQAQKENQSLIVNGLRVRTDVVSLGIHEPRKNRYTSTKDIEIMGQLTVVKAA